MGGKVFSTGINALYTPRMAPSVYNLTKAQCFAALKPFFSRVASPVEGPEKTSFGDIDILVSLEDSTFSTEQKSVPEKTAIWDAVEKALNAEQSYHTGKIITSKNIAIPWPTGLTDQNKADQWAVEEKAGEDSVGHKARYIQTDIRLCADTKELEWRLFNHAHGDLWNLIGTTIRPFGLTITDAALYIRIPEIERGNRNKARVFLSDNPTEVLDFLGMSQKNGEWTKPFSSTDALFEYATTCRWFMLWPQEFSSLLNSDSDSQDKLEQNDRQSMRQRPLFARWPQDFSSLLNSDSDSQDTFSKNKLKHNDRQRMRQRPVFARWIEDFIPRCLAEKRFLVADPKGTTQTSVRDQVRRLAFATFPGSEQAYNERLVAWNKEEARIFVKGKLIKEELCIPKDISDILPPPQEGSNSTIEDIEKGWRGVLRSALVKLVIDDSEEFEGIVPPRLRDKDGILLVDDIKKWIEKNWEAVGYVAWRENRIQTAKAYHEREERQKMKEAAQ